MNQLFIAVTNSATIERFEPYRRRGGFPPIDVLVSLPYLNDVLPGLLRLKKKGLIGRMFLDAGTFTLNAKGAAGIQEHRFEEYMELVERYGKYFDLIAAYDVDFGDPERNQCLYQQMLMRLKGK